MNHIGNSPISEKVQSAGAMSLDQPNDINRLSQWQIDFRQIEPGQMKTTVRLRAGGVIKLLEVSMSHSVHQTGLSPKGTISVGLIKPGQVKSWLGRDMSSTHLVSFGNSKSFDGISASPFRGLTISMDTARVEKLANSLGMDIPDALRSSGAPQIVGKRNSLGSLHSFTDRLLAGRCPVLDECDEEQIVVSLLLAANCEIKHADKAAPAKRARGLNRALDMMVAHGHENLAIGNICRETGTSWRTLDRAFNETFGLGPKRYYLNLRLNRVRAQLISNGDCVSISDAANEFGFWHLGEFAREYSILFGELPSDTVNRRM